MGPGKNASESDKRRVLVVEGHPLTRLGLQEFLGRIPHVVFCGGTGDRNQVLPLILSTKPDLLILDLHLNGFFCVDLLRKIRVHFPGLPVLAVFPRRNFLEAERVLQMGAKGIVTKGDSLAEIGDAVQKNLAGKTFVAGEVWVQVFHRAAKRKGSGDRSDLETLSNRELQVLQMIAAGSTNRKIAESLLLKIKTVQTYIKRIKKKLLLEDFRQLIHYAVQQFSEENRDAVGNLGDPRQGSGMSGEALHH